MGSDKADMLRDLNEYIRVHGPTASRSGTATLEDMQEICDEYGYKLIINERIGWRFVPR